MAQYKQSDNLELTKIINNAVDSSEKIESISDEVYLITLPTERTINSFFINLVLEKDDYDYGVAYIDILKESDLNTDHNRNFNTYAFFFEKNSNNTINQILDVNDYIYINFIPHPAFNINRTQNFDRLKDDDLVYAPVFPEQNEILRDDVYLPLFPIKLSDLENTSNFTQINDTDFYEIRNNNKRYINIKNMYNIFDDSSNISSFNSILNNFRCFPMGMFGNQIKNDPPFIFQIPNNLINVEGSKPLISNEYDAILNNSDLTIATKSNADDSAILRYILLYNNNINTSGGITGKYIKVSIDFFSKETKFFNDYNIVQTNNINTHEDDFINAGTTSNNTLMHVDKADGSGQPIVVDIFMLKTDKESTTNTTSEFNSDINVTQEFNLSDATPQNISQKISSNSNLGLDINEFMNNFNPQFAVNSSNIKEYFIIGYEVFDSEISNVSFNGYIKNSNQVQSISISTGIYAKYKVRIIWS